MRVVRAILPGLVVALAAGACGDDAAGADDAGHATDSSIEDADSPSLDAADSGAIDSGPDSDAAEPDWSMLPDTIRRERSLTWTQPELLDDRAALGLPRLMAAIAADGHGGRLLDHWFRRFATTSHSERLGPQLLLEQLASVSGDAPERWNLDDLPFRVTGVHNRLDLATDSRCGEIRVSLASTDAILQPFHLIFLFAQSPLRDDRASDGALHCRATAHRWAALSDLGEPAFLDAARAILTESIRGDGFLVAETLELLISPWEWRQWFLEPNADPRTAGVLALVLENRPLFQTVDSPRLNRPGPERDDFLAWVGENAAELDARRMPIPERFRALSARVNQGVPWVPLDLTGLSTDVASRYPSLRQHIEIVGCPACHATDAEFVQTSAERAFSPFYDKELDARGDHLRSVALGVASPPPFGPLQPDPRLPP